MLTDVKGNGILGDKSELLSTLESRHNLSQYSDTYREEIAMRRVMLLLVFAFSFIFAASVDAGTFFDDFDDGNDDGWFVEVGDWEVVDGVYRGLKTVPQWQTFALGGEAYGEFTIEVKIRNDAMALDLPDRCSIAGVAFAVGDDEAEKLNGVYWPGYYVYFRFHHGTLVLGSLAGELALKGVFAAGDVGNWHLLKAEVSDANSTLKTWVNGEEVFEWKLDDATGRIMLYTEVTGGASFDDVSIIGDRIAQAVQPDGKLAITWGGVKAQY